MRMRFAGAAHAAGARHSGARRDISAATGNRRGKGGENLGQAGRTTVWTKRSLPVAGADQYFVFLTALIAMKFVDRHSGFGELAYGIKIGFQGNG